jgi:hypothetical protein
VLGSWIYRLSDLTFEIDAPMPELHAVDVAPSAVETRVRWRAERPRPSVSAPDATFSSWVTADHDDWLTFSDVPGGYRLTFPDHGQFDVSRDGAEVSIHPFPDSPAETMRHLLLNQILPLVLSRRGRTVLHASAISYAGRVAAFIGRSGAGKSTLAVACARLGASIVADDCLVVYPGDGYPRDGGWSAVPCHAGVRLWPDALALFGWHDETGALTAHYSDKRRLDAVGRGTGDPELPFETRTLPLAGILYMPTAAGIVSQAPGPLRGRQRAMALASEVFRIDWRDPAESRRHFDAIAAIAAKVPLDVAERRTPETAASELLCRMTEGWRLP